LGGSHALRSVGCALKDNVPARTKKKRADEIMEVQSHISLELNEEKVGKVFKTLIDKVEGDYYIGRTQFDSPEVDNEVVIPKSEGYLRIGDFAEIEIVRAEHYDLIGKIKNA
jgi:ribosomal protein S12 methylthiotransferase